MPNPWLIVAVMLVIAGAFIGGYFKGRHDEASAQIEATLKVAKDVIKTEQTQSTVTENVEAADTKAQTQIQIVTNTIVKGIPVYVTKKADAKCIVPRGAVRVLSDAASGVPTVPGPTGLPDDSPAGIELSALVDETATDLGACRQIRQSYIDMQDWVSRQAGVLAPRP